MTDKPVDIPLEFKDWVKAYYVKAGFISSTDELRAAWDAAANAQLRRLHALNAELLEALEDVIADLEHEEADGWMSGQVHSDEYKRARATIAKVKGEKQ